MAVTAFVPLVFALAVAIPVVGTTVSERLDRVFTRFSVVLFGGYVGRVQRHKHVRVARLRAGHVPVTYRVYATKTLLYAFSAALVAGILGMYAIWLGLEILAIQPETIRATVPPDLWFLTDFLGVPSLSIVELFGLVVVTSLTLGAIAGFAVYYLRWWWPDYLADVRQSRIDASLPRTIAFVYALSRSGMSFPEVMKILGENRYVYGDAADEVGVAVRNMDLFGMDLITAVHTMGRRTPSSNFREFSENLASVLQSGRSLSSFLRSQYEAFQEEAEAQQRQLLDLLATLAEVYVTVFVAGALFLIVILVILGLSVGDTLRPLRVFVYVVLPLGNLAFILYLSGATDTINQSERLEAIRERTREVRSMPDRRTGGRTDGGRDEATPNLERLRAYRSVSDLRGTVGSPVRTVLERPVALLYVTVPLAAGFVALRLYTTPLAPVAVLDDALIQATLFLVGTFAIVYEIHRRRIEAIEAAVPDLLDRLASVNEAGMSIVESIDRVRGSELGALDAELDRVWADVRWGADIETALLNFERRVRTRTISRVVTLLTNAMNASGDLATVLRIAATQAKSDRRLKEQRQQEMVTYLAVVYISFFVFLFIVLVLSVVLIPNLPDSSIVGNASSTGSVPAVGGVSNIGDVDKDAYKLVFFHTAVIQGCLSGFVAGQLSRGDVREGAKHAAVLTAIAYLFYLVMV